MLPFFKIVVNEDDDTGVDFNAFVDAPAHMKGFIAFGKDQVRYSFSDEKRIVTGVMISVGTPIYRSDETFGEHYVVFDAPTVDIIRKKFFSNGFTQNVNADHDANKVIKGATLIDSFIVSNSDPKLPSVPQAFEHMKLIDGSWIASYYIKDNALWEQVKSGKFNGFSVEGWFDKVQINVTNKIEMNKKTKSIWEVTKAMFSLDAPTAETFASATTADGVVVSYEGKLGMDSQIFVESEGEQLPAPEGDHELTLEDGSIKIVTLDGSGIVTAIEDFVAEEEASSEVVELRSEVTEAIQEAMKAILKNTNDRFEAIEKENNSLKAELSTIKAGDKFKATPKGGAASVEGAKLSTSDLLKQSTK